VGALLWVSTICSAQIVDNFSLDNIDNERVSLDEIKGDKLTIIDFWATWCKPCTKAMPKLNSLYQKYQDKGVSFIGISCDGPRSISQVGAVVNSLSIDYPILTDIDCEVMNTHQFQAFPTLIMLNNNNKIIYVHEGFASGDEVEIEAEIVKQLK
jgi:thiol-disulfide isomerase/thioredoxin